MEEEEQSINAVFKKVWLMERKRIEDGWMDG